jgi:CubicO group peptidase (beta-lactamase class C family)
MTTDHMMLRCVSIAILVSIIATGPLGAVEPADKASRIGELLAGYAERDEFNGTVLVAGRGGLLFKEGYGTANFEWSLPNTPETAFRIGSVSKPFTAVMVMQLVDEGRLTLETRVGDVLPWYRQDTGQQVTIRQLLNHTGGIPFSLPEAIFCEDRQSPLSARDLVQTYHSGDLEFEPGTAFQYSNSDYVILGAVIEQVTGKPYDQVLEERILRPAGMRNTGLDYPGKVVPKRACGYDRTPEGPRGESFFDISFTHGAGGLYATVEDLYRWDRALYGEKLLSEQSRGAMFTPGPREYGLGWQIQEASIGPDHANRTVVRHAGDVLGFHAEIVRVLEDRLLVVLLANMGGAALGEISSQILSILYGHEPGASESLLAGPRESP